MLTGGRIHITHVSTAGSVEIVRRGKETGVRVTADATPHHLTLTEESVSKCGARCQGESSSADGRGC